MLTGLHLNLAIWILGYWIYSLYRTISCVYVEDMLCRICQVVNVCVLYKVIRESNNVCVIE